MSASFYDSIGNLLAFDSRDWSIDRADAWLWGIVHGWPPGAMRELQARHGWPDSEIKRLRKLHRAWKAAQAPKGQDT